MECTSERLTTESLVTTKVLVLQREQNPLIFLLISPKTGRDYQSWWLHSYPQYQTYPLSRWVPWSASPQSQNSVRASKNRFFLRRKRGEQTPAGSFAYSCILMHIHALYASVTHSVTIRHMCDAMESVNSLNLSNCKAYKLSPTQANSNQALLSL